MYVKKGRYKVEQVEVKCETCGKPDLRRVSDLARNKTGRVFCSRKCYVPCKPRTGTEKPCLVCGLVFYRQPWFNSQKYCSRRCQSIGHTKPKTRRTCETCGKEYELRPSEALAGAGRFCSKDCKAIGQTTRHAGFDYNGRPAIIDKAGYVRVWKPDHPKAKTSHGRILYHRLIMEEALGRYLLTEEHVDHINRIKTDNRPENLQLLSLMEHSNKTVADRMRDVADLKRYRELYGPLPEIVAAHNSP